jgi:hypothetical protein
MTKATFQRLYAASVLAMGAWALQSPAVADTILAYDLVASSSELEGSTATPPPTAFCAATSNCPGTPTFALTTNDLLSGTLSFDLGSGSTGTMSFDLTLTQNATLGGVVINAGSTIVGNDVSVQYSSTTKKGVTTYTIAPGTSSSVLVDLIPGSAYSVTADAPLIPGIECTATASSGSCIFTIGTSQAAANSLEIIDGGSLYNGVLGVTTTLAPVPLPAGGLLLLSGLGPLLLKAKRRSAR